MGDRERDRFWTVALVTDYVCFAVLPWIQTRPPRVLESGEPWRATFRSVNIRLLAAASIQVNTFPSGHAAEALAAALVLWDAPLVVVLWMTMCALAVSAGAPRHHGRAAQRSEDSRAGFDRAPAAGGRRADERDQGRAPWPQHVIVDQNPLENFKVLYGTGAVKLNDRTGRVERVGGVKYTIKDGIVYDAKQLLADVASMVEKQKRARAGKTSTSQQQ